MGRLMHPEAFEKNKVTLEIVKYFLTATFLFPLSFLLWYLSKKDNKRLYSVVAALLILSSISAASYIYVFQPLIKFHVDIGIYGAVVYGGILSTFFFLGRFIAPSRERSLLLIIYYIGYIVLVMSTLLWTVIPRYYLAHGPDKGSVLLAVLGLSWLIVSSLINHYNAPIKEEIAAVKARDTRIALVFLWLFAIVNCSLLKLIFYVSRRLY